jgi:plasmid maintenance system antidote protein VapI
MFENSMQMIHKAWGMAIGNSDDMEKMAEDLKKVDESVLASYMKQFVGEKEELKELISDETWLTAEEAIAFGLADEIWEEEESKDDLEGTENNVKENLFMKYKKQNNSNKPDNESGLFNAFKKSQGDDN